MEKSMEAKQSLLFFSYARADNVFALKLAKSLRSAGANLWIDQLDIRAGDRWERAVQQALTKAESLLIILSPSAVDSTNVMDEVSFALSKNKRIVPVLYKPCEIPYRLEPIQHIDFTGDFDHGLDRLLADLAIKRIPAEQAPASELALEGSLTDAVIWVEQYLAPQPLDLSDSIANKVRESFREAALEPKRQNLLPYIRSQRAQDRVVGYIAFQVKPEQGMVLDLIGALRLEHAHALEKLQTRPLWQLLLCFNALLDRSDTVALDRELIHKALADSLQFLEKNTQLDPGGQCKHRMRQMLKR